MIALTLDPESPSDAAAIEKLHERAFGPGRFARSAARIREERGHETSLSFVARVGTYLVGSVRVTLVKIGEKPALVLGPLTVEPAFEGRGIGRALLDRVAVAARMHGYELIVLVGDVSYYARSNYQRVPPGQITLPGPVDPARILARELEPGVLAQYRGMITGRLV